MGLLDEVIVVNYDTPSKAHAKFSNRRQGYSSVQLCGLGNPDAGLVLGYRWPLRPHSRSVATNRRRASTRTAGRTAQNRIARGTDARSSRAFGKRIRYRTASVGEVPAPRAKRAIHH